MTIVWRDHTDSRSHRSHPQSSMYQAIWPHRHPGQWQPNC